MEAGDDCDIVAASIPASRKYLSEDLMLLKLPVTFHDTAAVLGLHDVYSL